MFVFIALVVLSASVAYSGNEIKDTKDWLVNIWYCKAPARLSMQLYRDTFAFWAGKPKA